MTSSSHAQGSHRHQLLQVAFQMADISDGASLVYPRETKQGAPTMDQKINSLLIEFAAKATPFAGFIGEEESHDANRVAYWCVDPIDHTRNYLRGLPVWATQVSYVEEGRTLVCVISAPAIARRWWAVAGGGAYCAERRLRVSDVDGFEKAFISVHNAKVLERWGVFADLVGLFTRASSTLGLGNSLAHAFVAAGELDLAISAGGKAWDYLSLKLLLEEAGASAHLISWRDELGLISASDFSLLRELPSSLMGLIDGGGRGDA